MSLENKSYQDFQKWKSYANWLLPREPLLVVEGLNPLCGDEVKLYCKPNVEGKVQIVAVGGESCSICSAALGFLFKHQNKFQQGELSSYLQERKKILEGEETSLLVDLEERSFFETVRTHPSRHRCALLPWQTLLKILEVNK